MPEIQMIAVADTNEELVKKTAKQYKILGYTNPEHLIGNSQIDMVHIVTPPNTHFKLALSAIKNGKHVLCEKPLALSLREGNELISTAKQNKVIIPVNFILRYVPIVELVKKIIVSSILGNPIRAYFENYAADENMGPEHWFWNKKISGGIFLEHGVHFFDLYNYWFGQAKVLWAHSEKRADSEQEDRVFCFLTHNSGVLTNHYHGFDQPKILDRQLHRILFETGEIIIRGWIPESMTIHALCDDAKIFQLKTLFSPTCFKILKNISPSNQEMRGRNKNLYANQYILLEHHSKVKKLKLYSQAIISLLKDQVKFIRDSGHCRVITEENGLEALKLALSASKFS